MDFRSIFLSKRLFFDGAMGTMLQSAGLAEGELPESWNITHPSEVQEIHRKYVEAGCRILKTNTFGGNRLKLKDSPYSVEQIMKAAVENARAAGLHAKEPVFVAADLGPTGKLLKPYGDLAFEEAYELYKEMAVGGEKAGADLILIETINDLYELKAAVLAAKENTDLPIVATVTIDEGGKMLTGAPVEAVGALLEGLGVLACGFNCGVGPEQMLPLIKRLENSCSLPLVFNPNAGLPHEGEAGETKYDIEPGDFAQMMELIAPSATIMGGCCGTTPEHLKAMCQTCKEIPLPGARICNKTIVCSGMGAVTIGEKAVIIGERINPTGKSRFKQALREHDMDYILREGVEQYEKGAHILDVNIGLPEIDEPAMMEETVKALQAVVPVPLQLDTSDAAAMERGLRVVNGKPLINSVTGKKESMETIFPLVKKYGGVVVALTLDEEGIPDTGEERVKIARKIVETAESYGISRKDILIDVLTMTVSAGQSPEETLEALRRVKEELGVGTILGVSNVSFGLPQREVVNTAFFTMALYSGLDVAIINPKSDAMMGAYYATMALKGKDENCAVYIDKYGEISAQKQSKAVKTESDLSVENAVKQGLKEAAAKAAIKLLESEEPMDIVQNRLIPALDQVGQAFEKGTMFLPQLLMSADAAQAAFEQVKIHLAKVGGESVKNGKVVVATVQGDIHDIGKNIVKVLLDNYGYEVIDLGKDVPPEVILNAAREFNVKIVGLSALMTTTVPNMRKTIDLLKAEYPECKVIVGGAVLTPEYSQKMGADGYCRDAMATVNFAKDTFAK